MILSSCSRPWIARCAAGAPAGAVQAVGHGLVEDVVDERGLARPGDPGDARQHPQRDVDVDVAEVVLAGAEDLDIAARGRRRLVGVSIVAAPDRYWPVSDSPTSWTSAAVPWATIRPPCSPAPGPRSTRWSAARIVCSSCSTTITVLPRSRSRSSVAISFELSRWCRPIEGSSRMYSTPTSEEPIWVARRIRWASPPDSVAAARSIDR